MERHPFDVAILMAGHSRRTVIGSVAALAGMSAGIAEVPGKKKRKKRKNRKKGCARVGQPTSRKHQRCCAGLVIDASRVCTSADPVTTTRRPCKPLTCPADFCGSMGDGCGATLTCGCNAGQTCMFGTCRPCALIDGACKPCIMVGGVCQPCDVICGSDDPENCAVLPLQEAISGGGTVFVCPGRYSRSYSVSQPVKIIGAGDGDDPSTNTLLGYPGNTVLYIENLTGPVELERLRIADGRSNGGAGGISHGGATLRMTDCTVSGNTANYGAGIMVFPGRTLEMLRCKVIDNIVDQSSDTWGGAGILTDGATTLTDCLVANNHGGEGGGGINVGGGTTQLLG
jgi:hypothetical protein